MCVWQREVVRHFAFIAFNLNTMKVMLNMKRTRKMIKLSATIFFTFILMSLSAQVYEVKSPNGNLSFKLTVGSDIKYTVTHGSTWLIIPSPIALRVNGGTVLGANPVVSSTQTNSISSTITNLYGKNRTLDEVYNERRINFNGNYSLIIRAYDEGVAYRFVTSLAGEMIVDFETATFNLAGTPGVYFPEGDDALSTWERSYTRFNSISEIAVNRFSVTPTMFSYPAQGLRVLVAESDVLDYPGMYIQRTTSGMAGKWAAYPKTVADPDDIFKARKVLTRETYLAKTKGTREFPWRVVIVSSDDKDLLTNQLIYKLAKPSVIQEESFIVPGKSAWEWWHDAILETTTIPSGKANLTLELYKYYVDFAAQYKLEYMTLDAGWQEGYLAELCQYAATKGVKIFIWDFINLAVEDPNRLAFLKSFGIAGVKIDFIDRDDQIAINWLEDIAKRCAELELMVIFHGCSKPTGLERTYPNIVNYEAIHGAEQSKWNTTANPDYHLEFPFIRMLAGPLDYTPGSLRNVHVSQFNPIPVGIPNTMGTRARELAKYILFDQPLGYLCDSPTEYREVPNFINFLSKVPTVWDETIPLAAEVGEYAVLAKRKGEEWYVAAMTNAKARQVEIDFSFLPAGEYFAEVNRDNEFTDINAKVMTREVITVSNTSTRTFNLVKGGGAVLYISNLITGIQEEKKSAFTVFTDQTRTRLTIQSDDFMDTIYIVDILGRMQQVVYTNKDQKEVSIDLSNMPDGQLYLVYAKTAGGQRVAKFIK
jgi:alpha-glucosidase